MKKFLLYALTFILVTFAAAFGTIATSSLLIRSNSHDNNHTNIETPNKPTEKSDGEKLMDGLLNMGGTNINLNFNVYETTTQQTTQPTNTKYSNTRLLTDATQPTPKMEVEFNGKLSIPDLENIKVTGTINVKMSGQTISIDLTYMDGRLFIANQSMNIKMEVNSLSKVLALLPTLGIDIDLDSIMEKLDVDAILSNFQTMKAQVLESGDLLLPLNLTETLALNFITDANYVIKKVEANNLQFEGNTATLNADLAKDETIEITSPEQEKEYVDVTKTLNILDSVKEILTNKKFHLNLNANMVGKFNIGVNGNVDVDFNNDVDAFANLNVNLDGTTHQMSVGYVGQDLYIGFNNLKVMVSKTNLQAVVDTISSQFNIEQAGQNLLVEIAKIIPGFELSKILEGDLSNININNLLEFAKGEENVIIVNLKGKALGIENDLKLEIALDENDQLSSITLANIKLLDSDLSAKISYSSQVEIPAINKAQYTSLNDLSGLTNAVINTVKQIKSTKQVSLNLATNIVADGKPVAVNGVVTVDFNTNLKISANLTANLFNKTISVQASVVDGTVYMVVDNLKFKATFDDFKNIFASIKPALNNQAVLQVADLAKQILANTSVIVDVVAGNLNKLPQNVVAVISSTSGKFGLQLDKQLLNSEQNVDILLNYGTQISSIVLSNLDINNVQATASVSLGATAFVFDTTAYQFTDLNNTNKLISAVMNTVDNFKTTNKFAVNIASNLVVKGKTVAVNGDVAYNNGTIYVNLNAVVEGKTIPVEAHIKDNVIYLNLDGLKVKLPISKITDLTTILGSSVDVNAVLKEILPNFNFEQIKAGDLSSLSLGLIESIEIGETTARIELSNAYIATKTNIVLKLTYGEGLQALSISGIDIKDIQANANVTVYDVYGVPEIKGEYSDLSNITNLAAAVKQTVENLSNKQFALDLNLNVKKADLNLGVNGKLYLDLSNLSKPYNLESIKAYANLNIVLNSSYAVELWLENGVAYVNFQNQKVKISVESIKALVETIKPLLPTSETETEFDLTSLISGSMLEELLNKDFSNLTAALIKNISLTENTLQIGLAKELINLNQDVNLTVGYGTAVESLNIINLSISDIQANANINIDYTFVPSTVNTAEFNNLSGVENLVSSALTTVDNITKTKQIALSVDNVFVKLNGKTYAVTGTVYADLNNALTKTEQGTEFNLAGLTAYVNLAVVDTARNYTHNITAQVENDTIYVKYNNLKLSLAVANLKDIIALIKQIKFISDNLTTQDLSNISMRDLVEQSKQTASTESKFDALAFAKSILPGLDIDALLNKDFSKLDLSVFSHISIENQTLRVIFAKHLFDANEDLELNINFNDGITGLRFDGLNIKGISASGDVAILNSFDMPSVDTSEYTSLNNLKSAVNSALNTAVEVVDNKHISFGLQTQLINTKTTYNENNQPISTTETVVNLLPTSNAKFVWTNAYSMVDGKNKFDFTKMQISVNLNVVTTTNTYEHSSTGARSDTVARTVNNEHTIQINYLNNIAYVRYNNMYVKINGENIVQIINNVCELLGVETDSSVIDSIKNLVGQANDKSILNKLSVEMLKSISLTDSSLSLIADLSNMGFNTSVFNELKLSVDYSLEKLTKVTLKDLAYQNNAIDKVEICLNEFEPIGALPEGDYIDLSGVGDLLEAVNNSKNFKDFEIDGSVKLKINVIGININWDIPVNAKIKLLENGKFEASVKMGEIPVVVGVNNDVPFKTGNVSAGDKRMLYIYIKDEMVYIYRTEKVATLSGTKTYEKKMKVHMDTFLEDPLYYLLQYGFGMSDSIMSAINESMNKQRQNPLDYSNILKGFSASSNYYALTLNLKELAENDQLDTMTLGIRTTDYNGKQVVSGITLDVFMPVASSVEITIKTDNLNLVNIGGDTDMQTMYDFVANNNGLQEGAAWDAYNGDWKLSSQREFTLKFETNSIHTVADVKGIAGTEFALPVLENYYVDSATERTYYNFVGWYTSKDFAMGTEYAENILPRKDLTIYAKWETVVKKYVTISFVTNGGEAKDSITLLEGEKFELPTYVDLLIEVVGNTTYTKQFEGWFVDESLTTEFASNIAPSQDTVLYAKWVIMDSATSYQLTIYDAGQKLLVRRVLVGQTFTLNGSQFKDDTLYYLDSNFTNQIDIANFTMPEQDIELHIRNKYTAKIVSTKGTILDYTISLYQGETFDVAAQSSADWDTYANGQLSQHIYLTFNGYYIDETKVEDISSITMPNSDIEVIASWDEQIKNYFTISFSKDTNVTSAYKSDISFPVESLRVLEGETINLSNYTPTWVYSTGKWVVTWWHYEFEGWSTSKGGLNITSLTVTGDTTIYANWNGVVKTGKN